MDKENFLGGGNKKDDSGHCEGELCVLGDIDTGMELGRNNPPKEKEKRRYPRQWHGLRSIHGGGRKTHKGCQVWTSWGTLIR